MTALLSPADLRRYWATHTAAHAAWEASGSKPLDMPMMVAPDRAVPLGDLLVGELPRVIELSERVMKTCDMLKSMMEFAGMGGDQ